MLSTSTKMMGTVAEDQGSVKSEDSLTGRAKFLCSYGGKIMPRPHDSQLRYVGGETRILSVQRNVPFFDLMSKLRKLSNNDDNVFLKYQLPNEDLDALVSVLSEEDLENMMEEYDRVESKDSSSRLRLFLFPAPGKQTTQNNTVPAEQKLVEAENGVLLRKAEPTTQLTNLLAEDARKHVNVLQPATPPLVERQVPVPAVSNVVPIAPSSQVQQMLVPQVPYVPAGGAVLTPTLPQVLGAPSLVPPIVAAAATTASAAPVAATSVVPTVATATQAAQAAGVPQVVPGQIAASVVPNLVVPRVLPSTGPVPAAPLVRVAPPPGGPPFALVPAQVIAGGQGAQLIPQVIAHRPAVATSQPLAAKLDVFRGVLPKGRVLRQYPVDEDSVSSSSSQMTLPATSELIGVDRREALEEVLERPSPKVLDHGLVERLQELAINNQTPAKIPDSHLERYLTEQTLDSGATAAAVAASHPQPNVFFIPDVAAAHRQQNTEVPQRVASAPVLSRAVDTQMVHAKYLHRQFSDHKQDNSPVTSMRPQVPVVHLQQQVAPEMVLQIDERLPKPLLQPLNGVIRPAQEQVVDMPIKVVPQFVSPFHQAGP